MPDAHPRGSGDRSAPGHPGGPGPHGVAAAVVLAAGAGSRMRSATPKVLHPLGGRSMLGHAVHAVAGLSPGHLVVVVGHQLERVTDAVGAIGSELGTALDRPVATAVQEQRLGTGDAVRCGLGALPGDLAGTVLVTYGDVPLLDTATLSELVTGHESAGAAVTLLTCEPPDPAGYGRIVRDPADPADPARPVTAIVEHRDADDAQRAITEVNSGVYAFDAAFLREGLSGLAAHNEQQELYLTDLVAAAAATGRTVHALRCADEWLVRGVNDRAQLAEVRAELNRRVVHRWMLDGVTVIDPASTWVDVQVRLGTDVVLHPGTQLHGACAIGDRAEIGPDTTLSACAVGAGATVVRTHGSDSEIGEDASVGPFAYLRPHARLGPGGKIGTFVEVKNADIGAGSKVPHLTYVGDASIGEMSNIGASSVFVNYDGVRKQRTTVGSHVRIGSDTMFIAPVTVGDGAYTGAGTVLRSDVPPGALAVSGGTQRTIEGWVPRKRPGTAAAEAAERAGAVPPGTTPPGTTDADPAGNGADPNQHRSATGPADDLSRGGTAR